MSDARKPRLMVWYMPEGDEALGMPEAERTAIEAAMEYGVIEAAEWLDSLKGSGQRWHEWGSREMGIATTAAGAAIAKYRQIRETEPMQISLHDLHPNPYRDFDLHPIDQEQVERLKASIDADGFWASVVARKAADGYQIAFGHHRIEAARALGLETAPIEVRELSDWQMVRMLTSENATQRGSTAAAALDAVQAICRVLAYELLRWDEATFARFRAKVGIDYASCRGRLEAGSGIGTSCVKAFAPSGTLSEHQIRENLGVLKDSGRMATIIAAASARAETELWAEEEAAEHALQAAQDREARAASEAERKASATARKAAARTAVNRRQSTAGARKAAASAQRQPLIYDPRCTALFKTDSHAETFRQIITGETFQAYLPLDRQYQFAKSVLATIRENNPKRKEITATDIRSECWARIESGLGMFKQTMRTARERPFKHEVTDGLNFVRRAFNDYRRGIALLASALRKGEPLTAKQLGALDKYLDGIEAGLAIRNDLPKPKHNLKLVEG
jgi:hypothetical protein